MDKAREVALTVLKEVNMDGKYANFSLKEHLNTAKMDERDARLATQLVYGTLENQEAIDRIIGRFVKQKQTDPWVENILRMGCYQILYLDKIPDSAACNEAVELCKKYASKFLAGFVNGVLRNIVRNKKDIPISQFQQFPSWLVEKWRREYGRNMAEQMTAIDHLEKGITIRINTLASNRDMVIEQLEGMGIEADKGLYFDEALRIRELGNIADNPLYKKGDITVQSESSMLVAHILNPQMGENILDVCSAPGGKAIHIAELMKGRGNVYAWDVHPHRVELIKRNCKRMNAGIVYPQEQDARIFRPELEMHFDRVLIDAPCSGLGVAHHKPDIKLKITPEKLEALSRLQWDIISVCCRYVKPGGTLVYSTCTMNPDENERIVQKFIRSFDDFVMDGFDDEIPDSLKQAICEPGAMQLIPGRDGLDGFFIARMRRKA